MNNNVSNIAVALIDCREKNLKDYLGKILLFINVASCIEREVGS